MVEGCRATRPDARKWKSKNRTKVSSVIRLWRVVLTALFLTPSVSHATEMPKEAKEDIYRFLKDVHTLGSSLDDVLGGMISSPGFVVTVDTIDPEAFAAKSSRYNISWWKVFGDLLVADKLLAQLGDRDYDGAMRTAGAFAIKKLIARAPGKSALAANGVAGIGTFALELYLNSYADLVARRGFENQMELYFAARNFMDHDRILSGEDNDMVKFSILNNGYISNVVGQERRYFFSQPTRTFDKDKFFELARLSYDSPELRERLAETRDRAIREFAASVIAGIGEKPKEDIDAPLEGVWIGMSTAGSRRLDYRWAVEQPEPGTAQGTISLKFSGAPDWRTYRFVGLLEQDTLFFQGTSWVTSNNDPFCMVEGRVRLVADSGSISLEGRWGPLNILGGCPPGSGGTIKIVKQSE